MAENADGINTGPVTEEASRARIGIEGEFPCVLVYSDCKHVDYIYPLLSVIENILKERGYKTQRLGDEIRSGEDYLEKITKLIDGCVLGVVILDGFRPNVIFEFGLLRGKEKPIILLQDEKACVNVKTLYRNHADSGLTESNFSKILKNPSLDAGFHLSDFAGKHVCFMNWRADNNDAKHPATILNKELGKHQQEVIEAFKNAKTREMKVDYPVVLQELIGPLTNILNFYMNVSDVPVKRIKEIHNSIIDISNRNKIQLPYEIHGIITGTYLAKADEIGWRDKTATLECLSSAIRTNEEALKVRTLERFPMQYATIQNNLGTAYSTLAEVEAKADNCQMAIKAYEEALKIFTKGKSPEVYPLMAKVQKGISNLLNTS